MTPFEIALAIRNRADPDESVESFVLRTMAKETMADLGAALELAIGWERANEDIVGLCDAIEGVAAKAPDDAPMGVLVDAKRKLGYDPKLEALLARRWRCPHCKQYADITRIKLPIGAPDRLPQCTVCGEEGIAPVDPKARLDVHDGGKSGLRPT